ncbi:uncharacterized protein LOC129581855 isoform X2 [Paramacrobiotus metropolitanus]|uniref:uncharacterized protein LOC129581855 isoform X2 n=1 Tax=Paramacrobiotus metropolitanus TaxID=2943436 RepID=UPI0024461E95|nr:uncharacterized protein LOC129581855 isoform X2 [Paramacrobiotus metropolitanus]
MSVNLDNSSVLEALGRYCREGEFDSGVLNRIIFDNRIDTEALVGMAVSSINPATCVWMPAVMHELCRLSEADYYPDEGTWDRAVAGALPADATPPYPIWPTIHESVCNYLAGQLRRRRYLVAIANISNSAAHDCIAVFFVDLMDPSVGCFMPNDYIRNGLGLHKDRLLSAQKYFISAFGTLSRYCNEIVEGSDYFRSGDIDFTSDKLKGSANFYTLHDLNKILDFDRTDIPTLLAVAVFRLTCAPGSGDNDLRKCFFDAVQQLYKIVSWATASFRTSATTARTRPRNIPCAPIFDAVFNTTFRRRKKSPLLSTPLEPFRILGDRNSSPPLNAGYAPEFNYQRGPKRHPDRRQSSRPTKKPTTTYCHYCPSSRPKPDQKGPSSKDNDAGRFRSGKGISSVDSQRIPSRPRVEYTTEEVPSVDFQTAVESEGESTISFGHQSPDSIIHPEMLKADTYVCAVQRSVSIHTPNVRRAHVRPAVLSSQSPSPEKRRTTPSEPLPAMAIKSPPIKTADAHNDKFSTGISTSEQSAVPRAQMQFTGKQQNPRVVDTEQSLIYSLKSAGGGLASSAPEALPTMPKHTSSHSVHVPTVVDKLLSKPAQVNNNQICDFPEVGKSGDGKKNGTSSNTERASAETSRSPRTGSSHSVKATTPLESGTSKNTSETVASCHLDSSQPVPVAPLVNKPVGGVRSKDGRPVATQSAVPTTGTKTSGSHQPPVPVNNRVNKIIPPVSALQSKSASKDGDKSSAPVAVSGAATKRHPERNISSEANSPTKPVTSSRAALPSNSQTVSSSPKQSISIRSPTDSTTLKAKESHKIDIVPQKRTEVCRTTSASRPATGGISSVPERTSKTRLVDKEAALPIIDVQSTGKPDSKEKTSTVGRSGIALKAAAPISSGKSSSGLLQNKTAKQSETPGHGAGKVSLVATLSDKENTVVGYADVTGTETHIASQQNSNISCDTAAGQSIPVIITKNPGMVTNRSEKQATDMSDSTGSDSAGSNGPLASPGNSVKQPATAHADNGIDVSKDSSLLLAGTHSPKVDAAAATTSTGESNVSNTPAQLKKPEVTGTVTAVSLDGHGAQSASVMPSPLKNMAKKRVNNPLLVKKRLDTLLEGPVTSSEVVHSPKRKAESSGTITKKQASGSRVLPDLEGGLASSVTSQSSGVAARLSSQQESNQSIVPTFDNTGNAAAPRTPSRDAVGTEDCSHHCEQQVALTLEDRNDGTAALTDNAGVQPVQTVGVATKSSEGSQSYTSVAVPNTDALLRKRGGTLPGTAPEAADMEKKTAAKSVVHNTGPACGSSTVAVKLSTTAKPVRNALSNITAGQSVDQKASGRNSVLASTTSKRGRSTSLTKKSVTTKNLDEEKGQPLPKKKLEQTGLENDRSKSGRNSSRERRRDDISSSSRNRQDRQVLSSNAPRSARPDARHGRHSPPRDRKARRRSSSSSHERQVSGKERTSPRHDNHIRKDGVCSVDVRRQRSRSRSCSRKRSGDGSKSIIAKNPSPEPASLNDSATGSQSKRLDRCVSIAYSDISEDDQCFPSLSADIIGHVVEPTQAAGGHFDANSSFVESEPDIFDEPGVVLEHEEYPLPNNPEDGAKLNRCDPSPVVPATGMDEQVHEFSITDGDTHSSGNVKTVYNFVWHKDLPEMISTFELFNGNVVRDTDGHDSGCECPKDGLINISDVVSAMGEECGLYVPFVLNHQVDEQMHEATTAENIPKTMTEKKYRCKYCKENDCVAILAERHVIMDHIRHEAMTRTGSPVFPYKCAGCGEWYPTLGIVGFHVIEITAGNPEHYRFKCFDVACCGSAEFRTNDIEEFRRHCVQFHGSDFQMSNDALLAQHDLYIPEKDVAATEEAWMELMLEEVVEVDFTPFLDAKHDMEKRLGQKIEE